MAKPSDKGSSSEEPEYRVYRGAGAGKRVGPKASTAAGRSGTPDGGSGGGGVASRGGGVASRGGGGGSPGGSSRGGGSFEDERPYTTYRSLPRGLLARLRGESDPELSQRAFRSDHVPRPPREDRTWLQSWGWRRAVKYVAVAIVGWLLLGFVLFMISAEDHAGDLPAGATEQLTSGGSMLTSANTVLVLGLDNRPKSGAGSKEPGSNYSEAAANTDSIMLWRIGGGVSRRLSIPRDTLVDIPGLGDAKINAAWSYGGPGLALKVIKQFTGLQINHLIVVDLGNFPKFIDDIGGVTVKTPKICSNISGGTARGGFTLDLNAGVHHLSGEQAMVLARTRENSCNRTYNDLNREGMQQQIMNGIKSQLLTFHTFLHLPWAAWDAPGVIQTDMGGLTLMQLFIASEIGGSAPVSLLSETGESYGGADVLVPNRANVQAQVQKFLTGN
jgi:LCP family protein required for cell wall assembly